jgi:CheY-like chemotaxis protein
MAKTVMIVDDEADVRSTVKAILEKSGYATLAASSGDECLKAIEGGAKPDLILLDIMMPGISVKAVAPKVKDIKVLYFSSVMMTEEEKKDLAGENVMGFVQKPLDIDDFVKKVGSII